MERIVSFLPAATELVYALGAQDRLFGVTHECRHPGQAAAKPRVIDSVIDSGMSSGRINDEVRELLQQGKEIFEINEANLRATDPDLIILQDTCEVCAPYADQAERAIRMLDGRPEIYHMNPHSVEEVIESVRELGAVLGAESEAAELASNLRARVSRAKKAAGRPAPRVLAVEWMEPLYTAGHWVPEMVEIAGGENLLSKTGQRSRIMEISEIADASPEIIVMMPCGFDAARTASEYDILRDDKRWSSLDAVREGRVYAVDADSFFSKPGIRIIDGIEILSRILWPYRYGEIPAGTGYLRI